MNAADTREEVRGGEWRVVELEAPSPDLMPVRIAARGDGSEASSSLEVFCSAERIVVYALYDPFKSVVVGSPTSRGGTDPGCKFGSEPV